MQQEHISHEEIKSASNRSFGLTVGGILGAIEAYRWWHSQVIDEIGIGLLVVAIPLILFGAIYPPILTPLNKAWNQLGLFMFKVVNPIIMFGIYITAMVPIGLIMKIVGKDPLHMQLDPDAKSYWIERAPRGPSPESMKNQF